MAATVILLLGRSPTLILKIGIAGLMSELLNTTGITFLNLLNSYALLAGHLTIENNNDRIVLLLLENTNTV